MNFTLFYRSDYTVCRKTSVKKELVVLVDHLYEEFLFMSFFSVTKKMTNQVEPMFVRF